MSIINFSAPIGNKNKTEKIDSIPRDQGVITSTKGHAITMNGWDRWNIYDFSWLNMRGKPEIAILVLKISSSSPRIPEAGSAKCYFEKYADLKFESTEQIISLLQKDLQDVCQAKVEVDLYRAANFDQLNLEPLSGRCIDDLDITGIFYHPDATILSIRPQQIVTETLTSHLLKLHCMFTGKADWANIQISYTGPKIDASSLLTYIISYRKHFDIHEHCIEMIYSDIMRQCSPLKLSVYGQFARFSGMDINPLRCSF